MLSVEILEAYSHTAMGCARLIPSTSYPSPSLQTGSASLRRRRYVQRMSALEEIRSLARSAAQALEEAGGSVAEASALADELEESAAGHGWGAVATTMSEAQAGLVELGEALGDSRTAIGEELNRLSAITAEASSDEIARHLGAALLGFNVAGDAAELALRCLEEARLCAQQADATRIDEILGSVEEDISKGQEILRAAVEGATSEQAEAAAWGTAGDAERPAAGEPPAPLAHPEPIGEPGPTKTDRLKEHLTDRDLEAARRELKGEVVALKPDGTPWDHVREVREAQLGLVNRIKQLKRRLKDSRTTEIDKPALEAELSEASRLLDHSERFVPRESPKKP
jgi:hypothetical protein